MLLLLIGSDNPLDASGLEAIVVSLLGLLPVWMADAEACYLLVMALTHTLLASKVPAEDLQRLYITQTSVSSMCLLYGQGSPCACSCTLSSLGHVQEGLTRLLGKEAGLLRIAMIRCLATSLPASMLLATGVASSSTMLDIILPALLQGASSRADTAVRVSAVLGITQCAATVLTQFKTGVDFGRAFGSFGSFGLHCV